MKYTNRIIIGFDGRCPLNCKHCYAHGLDQVCEPRSISQLVASIEEKDFDIIYLSQKNETFYDEKEGLAFCEALYNKYKKDIYIITRSNLSDNTINELARINSEMGGAGNKLIVGISICANESFLKTESNICPSPSERLVCMKKIHQRGIKTILTIRPVFPDWFIPVSELKEIINKASDYYDCVVSSGLIASEHIIADLGMNLMTIKYLTSGDSTYLDDINKNDFKFLDVEEELNEIEATVLACGKNFYRHSMQALNSIV